MASIHCCRLARKLTSAILMSLVLAGSATISTAQDVVPPTVTISLVPADVSHDFVKWNVTFSEPVAPTFTLSDLAATGPIPHTAYITGTDPNYSVIFILDDIDADGSMAFSITGAVQDPSGNPLSGPRVAPGKPVQNFPAGDVNKDETLDIADVALLADANLGLIVLP